MKKLKNGLRKGNFYNGKGIRMRKAKGNMFSEGVIREFLPDALVITTNGFVKDNGECVMGAGCALEAKRLWPDLPKELGTAIQNIGNQVFVLKDRTLHFVGREWKHTMSIIAFPVKYVWYDVADPVLIARSAAELANYSEKNFFKCILLPRPGCGNGKLNWEDIKPILDKHLDDRFVSMSL